MWRLQGQHEIAAILSFCFVKGEHEVVEANLHGRAALIVEGGHPAARTPLFSSGGPSHGDAIPSVALTGTSDVADRRGEADVPFSACWREVGSGGFTSRQALTSFCPPGYPLRAMVQRLASREEAALASQVRGSVVVGGSALLTGPRTGAMCGNVCT
ncbi:uncharacterized protein BDZ99DRAFT_54840 [Mytilinidion resinicola]|uniref:Uncharacterized protein n=1 Tax=Mytilinidion resinicola TaxID=574789 RepID=A0A6A6YKA2_9PEZI|nr:uncharacterized protein BDZ99DRAFT_54840 [Mytilinidion resinicola]KAF2808394.1 hypothetical protein BDZ99DRAFT_54840 [Mytilinidion resinicola]